MFILPSSPRHRVPSSPGAAFTLSSYLPKTLTPTQHSALLFPISISFSRPHWKVSIGRNSWVAIRAAINADYSAKRSRSSEPRETIMLPGCDYNHWLIVMGFPKDPAPTRAQMIETYLNTLATVLGSMEEAKKNMYAFNATTYTGFQCTVDEEASEKFKALPGVLWVLPDS